MLIYSLCRPQQCCRAVFFYREHLRNKMNKALRQLIAPLTFLVVSAVAQDIAIVPKERGIYSTGEKAIWSIEVMDQGEAFEGEVHYSLKAGGLTVLDEGTLILEDGKTTFEASPVQQTGTLLLEVRAGKKIERGGAVFNPELIQPSYTEPSDFDSFWQSKIAELEAVPMNVRLEKVDAGEHVEYWKITMDNIRGTKIRGQIAKPKNSSGKLPVMLQVQWAGVYPLKKEWVTGPAKNGWLAMNILAHDLPIDREMSFYNELEKGALNYYPGIGNEDRDTSYFLRMYLSCYRAVEYLTNHPDWNEEVLYVKGTSQGGLQAIMISGLHPAVTAVSANVPAGCDQTGELVGREPGWPKWVRSGNDETRDARIKVASYYDVVNFAKRVKSPALVAVGLIDVTCPPEGVIAMYNQLSGPKKLIVLPVSGHRNINGSQDLYYDADLQWSQALKVGKPLSMQ